MKKLTVYAGTATTEVIIMSSGDPILAHLIDVNAWRAVGQYNRATLVDGKPYTGTLPTAAQTINAITVAWNGAAFDYASKTMHVVVPGGHSDSWNNECYAYTVGNGWVKTRAQTAFPPDRHLSGYAPVNGFGSRDNLPTRGDGFYLPSGATGAKEVLPKAGTCQTYFDGSPCSRHVYAGSCWLPTQQRVLLIGGGCWGGTADKYCGWFDPATGTWAQKADLPYGQGTGFTTAYDAARDLVYWETGIGGMAQLWAYSPATDTHTRLLLGAGSPLNSSIGGNYTVMHCDGTCDYLYAMNIHGWGQPLPVIARRKLGLATSPWELVPISGDTTAVYGYCPGMEYDPERNAFVWWSREDPSNYSVMQLDTFAIAKFPLGVTPDITQNPNGTWGRWRRYDVNKYLLFTNPNLAPYELTLP